MRASASIESACLESALPKAGANVYDLAIRQEGNIRLRRIKALERENALLMRTISEIQIEIVRLRKLLTAP